MYNSITNYKEPEPEKDILDDLEEAEAQQAKIMQGAMIVLDGPPQKSLLKRAIEEIETLRRRLDLYEEDH